MKQEEIKTKCYCGHTTNCDCSLLETEQEALEKAIRKLSKSISKLDDAVKELSIERINFSKSINDFKNK